MSRFVTSRDEERKKKFLIGGGITAAIIIISALLYAGLHTTELSTEVQLHEWQRNIDIEQYEPVRYTREWTYPSDAYNVHEYEEDSSYRDKNGNLVHDSDTYYDYTVDEWTYSRTLSSTGHDKEPQWPSVTGLNIQNTVSPEIGQERERGRSTHLFVHLFHKETNKTYRAEIEKSEQWLRIELGQMVTAHVNHFGTVRWVTDQQ